MAVEYSLFINDVQKASEQSGVPASVTLAQIILESGGKYENGLSGLAYNYKNLFGVKGTGTAGSISLPTKEVRNGQYVTENAKFRVYNSFYDSILDHNRLLNTERYVNKTKNAQTLEEYVKGIHAAGYATDPKYADKLLGIIKKHNLDQYDNGKIKPSTTPNTISLDAGSNEGGVNNTETKNVDSTKTFTENLFFNITRVGVIAALGILMVVFFLKAFPVVEDVASAVPAARVVNVAKKASKAVKKKGG